MSSTRTSRDGVAALARELVTDRIVRAAFRYAPADLLDEYGVAAAELPELGAHLSGELVGWPVADQRATLGLVFHALVLLEESP